MNNKSDKDTPRFDVQLLFDEIGVLLDDNQYRDAISLVDMYHFYTRQHQVLSYFIIHFTSNTLRSTTSTAHLQKSSRRAKQKRCGSSR